MSNDSQTILIVEDDPDDGFFIQRAFKNADTGGGLRLLKDGEEAIDYLYGKGEFSDRNQHPLPVLMLIDLKMPRRSGLEVLEWVRQQPDLRRLLVVMLTSSKHPSDVARAYDLGVNAYLVKPVDFSDLQEIITALKRFMIDFVEKPALESDSKER